ncbi:hypothetical protein L7F22_067443 [Adiantum nelumboides]|nr:hypothetical protein [Adiantum nelumboides]
MLDIVAGRKLLDPTLRSDVTGDESSNSQYNISSTDFGQEDAARANALRWHLPSGASQKSKDEALLDVVDERLQTRGFDEQQAQRILYAALWSIQEELAARPNAAMVVKWLESSSFCS